MSRLHIKIEFSFALTLLFFYLFDKLEVFITFFICAILHEIMHLLVCIILKEKVRGVKIAPYGVCLQCEFIKNPLHLILVSISGPVFNLILYLLFKNRLYLFSYANLSIFIINMFPFLPLDGGAVLKALFTLKFGYVKSYKFMINVSRVFSIITIFFGIILVFITKYNISLLIIGLFLLYNIKSERNGLIYLKNKLLTNEFFEKNFIKVKNVIVNADTFLVECIDNFEYNTLLNVTVLSKCNTKICEFSQYEIVDLLLNNNTYIKFLDVIKMKGYNNELKGQT